MQARATPLDSTGLDRSAPEGRSTTSLPAASATRPADRADARAAADRADPALLRASFRELHGRHLHGFALLVTLGDRSAAARLAGDALADATERLVSLTHPERAAAWLRRHVLSAARRRGFARRDGTRLPLTAERLTALSQLGLESAPASALASLDVFDRAALALANVERLGDADIADALGMGARSARRRVRRARQRYADQFVRQAAPVRPGPLTELLRNISLETMGPRGTGGQ